MNVPVSRYEEFAVVRATRQEVESALQEKLNECDHWHNAHKVKTSLHEL